MWKFRWPNWPIFRGIRHPAVVFMFIPNFQSACKKAPPFESLEACCNQASLRIGEGTALSNGFFLRRS